MTEITEEEIKETFGDKTFYKGLDYYDGRRVLDAVRIGSDIYGQVLGSSSKPYEVRASTSEMHTECTCPVGSMCKHGVALLLKWMHDPSSFIDADKFLVSLEKLSKSEIIGVIEEIIKRNPSLISEFSIEKEEKPDINIDAISEKIGWIVHGELDYYSIDDAIENLEGIKRTADRLKEKGSHKNAADIYLALVKGGVTAYEVGADDSNGSLGDFVIQCVTSFNECMEMIDDISYKNRLLERILEIVEEDYGLETEEMLYGIVTDENIRRIEEYLLEKLEEKRKSDHDFSYKYKKEGTLELLIGLYGKLGKPGEKLRLARYELADREDYARLANVLLEENMIEEAFDTARKGLMLSGEPLSELNNLYFALAGRLFPEKPELVDFKTSLAVALEMFSRQFDIEEYEAVKKVFSGIGKLEEFRPTMLVRLKNRDSAVCALLHDGELKSAIDMVRAEPGISSRLIIDVARAAMENNLTGESAILTRMVLERGWADDRPPVKELLNSMVKSSDTGTLGELCEHISKKGYSETAILLIPHLMKKAPELSGMLAKNFINSMPVELVIKVADEVARKAPDEGVSLCRLRISEDILRSHVHYDKAVLLLRAVRDIYVSKGNEAKWTEFIRGFAAENKGKKKLIEKVRKEFGVV